VALLRKRWKERASDTGLVFSADGEKAISDMTMTKLLRDDGIKPSWSIALEALWLDKARSRT